MRKKSVIVIRNTFSVGKVVQVNCVISGVGMGVDAQVIIMCVAACDFVSCGIFKSYCVGVSISFIVFYNVVKIIGEVNAFTSIVYCVILHRDVVCGVCVSHHENVIDAPTHNVILYNGVMSAKIDPYVGSRIFDDVIYYLDVT